MGKKADESLNCTLSDFSNNKPYCDIDLGEDNLGRDWNKLKNRYSDLYTEALNTKWKISKQKFGYSYFINKIDEKEEKIVNSLESIPGSWCSCDIFKKENICVHIFAVRIAQVKKNKNISKNE